MAIDSKTFGIESENLVAEHLKKEGYKIKHQNYRQRFGEIDLIAEKGEVLAFIEVKARKKNYFGLSEVVNYSKQKKIILAAKAYLAQNHYEDKVCRFDVALVENKKNKITINYISNAFCEGF